MIRNPFLILALVLTAPVVQAQTTNSSTTQTPPTTNGRVSPAPLNGDPMTTTNVVPGDGFSPLTATDSQLAAYGFPPRPYGSPQALVTWTKAMQTSITRVIPTAITNTGHQHGPVSLSQSINLNAVNSVQLSNGALTNPAAIGSYNWSGYMNQSAQSGAQFAEAWAEIEVPRAEQAVGTCGGADYSSQWVGIDGAGSPDVLQTGAEADAFCYGNNYNNTVRTYTAWYEWYPFGEVHIDGLPIHAGDDLFVAVWATSPTTGNIYIVNYDTGQYVSLTLTSPAGTQLQGNSAEYVVEAPNVAGNIATLTNYGADYFTSVYAQDNAGNPYDLSAAGATPVIMVDSNNNPISYPTLLGTNAIWMQDYGSAW